MNLSYLHEQSPLILINIYAVSFLVNKLSNKIPDYLKVSTIYFPYLPTLICTFHLRAHRIKTTESGPCFITQIKLTIFPHLPLVLPAHDRFLYNNFQLFHTLLLSQ